jgi:predicted nucleotidyltransferase
MDDKDDILLNLKKLNNDIKVRYKIQIKCIFGSYVRNENRD